MKTIIKHIPALQLAGVVFFVVVWFFVSSFFLNQTRFFLASPIETFIALSELLKSQQLMLDVFATIQRTAFSFVPAVIFGVVSAFILSLNSKIYRFFEILIDFFRSIPVTAIFPLFLLAFGISENARIGTAFFVSYWIILINTYYGIAHNSPIRKNLLLSLKANKIQVFIHGSFWEILPFIFSGMKLSVSVALIIIVITEMFISPLYGLGTRILTFQQTFSIDKLFAVILVTGFTGWTINKIIQYMEKKIIHWNI